ncbi:MAG TPA: peptide deformylase [Firmicutes bacterium]|nr:peptide deformylase [Bacillota bacterium]HAV20257.1 peptide deformylase [Bacillota bacterium]
MKLKIYNDSAPYLRNKSKPVPLPLEVKQRRTLLAMIDYLKKSQDPAYAEKHHIREGIGLAAPQIGINLRMLVVYFEKDDQIVEHGFVNPIIISKSVKLTYIPSGEGCLSVDEEYRGYVLRPHKVVVRAFDIIPNKEVELTFRGFAAIVVQHEIDHLDGILFYDRINKQQPFLLPENVIVAD